MRCRTHSSVSRPPSVAPHATRIADGVAASAAAAVWAARCGNASAAAAATAAAVCGGGAVDGADASSAVSVQSRGGGALFVAGASQCEGELYEKGLLRLEIGHFVTACRHVASWASSMSPCTCCLHLSGRHWRVLGTRGWCEHAVRLHGD